MDDIETGAYLQTLINLRQYEARHGCLPKRWFVDRYTYAELRDDARAYALRPGWEIGRGTVMMLGVEIVERVPVA
jgi:hypothetical protein